MHKVYIHGKLLEFYYNMPVPKNRFESLCVSGFIRDRGVLVFRFNSVWDMFTQKYVWSLKSICDFSTISYKGHIVFEPSHQWFREEYGYL